MANHVTPTGSVAWAALLEPQQDAYNDEMNWNVGLVLTEEDLAPVLEVFEKTIEDAVIELKNAFVTKKLNDTLSNEFYFNIKRMNNIHLK